MVPMDGMIEPSINVNEDALTLDVRVRKSALQARHGYHRGVLEVRRNINGRRKIDVISLKR